MRTLIGFPDEEGWNESRSSLITKLTRWDNSRAWQGFFNIYALFFYARARRAGLSVQDAEDVVQEVMAEVAKRMPGFKCDPHDQRSAKFRAWLCVIVRAKIADRIRVLVRGQQAGGAVMPVPNETGTSPVERLPDPNADPGLRERADWAAALLRAAAEIVKQKFSPEYFAIYDFHVLQWHTVKETMEEFGISRAKVYLVKFRVGGIMRRELKRMGHEPRSDKHKSSERRQSSGDPALA
jgi:RNA polymerase sigma-70 factor (ECF subfamily)